MKLKLKNTPEQVELIAALGSRNQAEAREAQEAFAAFIGPVIQEVIKHSATTGMIYSDLVYDEDDSPSIPLDLWYNENAGYVNVWSQSMAGGLPTSQVEGVKEIKVSTYRIDSAVSWLKKYARKHRLDVVGKALERMAQEILVKQERNGWAVILKALANSNSQAGKGVLNTHILKTGTADKFVPGDISKLMTHMRRLGESFANGTPSNDSFGLTDLFVSPEVKEQIRAYSYEAFNATNTGGALGLPDSVREGVWSSGGMSEIYGVTLHDILELGDNEKYNSLFAGFLGAGNLIGRGNSDSSDFNGNSNDDQIMVGVDMSRDALVRPVARQMDSGGTFTALPDDQFQVRADKVGFYGFLEEGRVCIDARALAGLVM